MATALALTVLLLTGSACAGEQTAQPPNTSGLDATLVARCFGPSVTPGSVTRAGDILFYGDVGPIVFPQAQLPDSAPLQPYKLTGDPAHGFPGSFVRDGYIDPLGPTTPFATNFSLLVCNTSATTSHVLSAITVQIAHLTLHNGAVNAWQPLPCSTTYFSTSAGVVNEGGCGGSNVAALYVTADFTDQATPGTVAKAQDTGGEAVHLALPPGATSAVSVSSRLPHTPGTYTFALGVGLDSGASVYTPPSHPALYAPITHEWDGVSCQADAMRAQLPALGSGPTTYYLCPRS